jgi:hypothetical protein
MRQTCDAARGQQLDIANRQQLVLSRRWRRRRFSVGENVRTRHGSDKNMDIPSLEVYFVHTAVAIR